MTEHEEALSLLRQIERNQQRGLEMQAEQLALVYVGYLMFRHG